MINKKELPFIINKDDMKKIKEDYEVFLEKQREKIKEWLLKNEEKASMIDREDSVFSLREAKMINQKYSPSNSNNETLHGSFKNRVEDEKDKDTDFSKLYMVVEKLEDGFKIKNVSEDEFDKNKQIILLAWNEIFSGDEKSSDVDNIIDNAKEKAFERLKSINNETKNMEQEKDSVPTEDNNPEDNNKNVDEDERVNINFDEPSEDDLASLFDEPSEDEDIEENKEEREDVKIEENKDADAEENRGAEKNNDDLEHFISSSGNTENIELDDNKKNFPIFPSEYPLLIEFRDNVQDKATTEEVIEAVTIDDKDGVINGFDVDGYRKELEQTNENSNDKSQENLLSESGIEIDAPVEKNENLEHIVQNMPQ